MTPGELIAEYQLVRTHFWRHIEVRVRATKRNILTYINLLVETFPALSLDLNHSPFQTASAVVRITALVVCN